MTATPHNGKGAVSWVIAEQLPVFATEVTTRRTQEYERVRERVAARLTREVNRLYTEALKTDADAAAGKKVRYSAETLHRRAEELEQRRESRLALIDRQLAMSPVAPRITAIAMVMPAVAEPRAAGDVVVSALARAEVERRGVDAVLAAERALDRDPEEQVRNTPGFDVLSRPVGSSVIRIEVRPVSRVPTPSPSPALRGPPRSTPHPTPARARARQRQRAAAGRGALHRKRL